jgi:hypothetical protein
VFIDALRYCGTFIVSDKQASLLGVLDPEGEDPAGLQVSATANWPYRCQEDPFAVLHWTVLNLFFSLLLEASTCNSSQEE